MRESEEEMNVQTQTEKLPVRYYPTLSHYDHREFVCGWGAAMINICVTFPIHKLIFRQMLHDISVRDAFSELAGEGLHTLYRGVLPPLIQKSISSSLMFGIYDMFRKPLLESGVNPFISNSFAAVSAGTVEAVLAPFERIQTLLQDTAYQKDFINMRHAVSVLRTEYGIKEFYRGLTPILCRNGPSNVSFFLFREEVNKLIPDHISSVWYLNAVKQFVIGACIGAFNSTIFYPFNVIKVHMQSQLGGPYYSIFYVVKEVYIQRDRKIRNFYKGVHMNYTRSFIGWGVVNLAYENLKLLLFTEMEGN